MKSVDTQSNQNAESEESGLGPVLSTSSESTAEVSPVSLQDSPATSKVSIEENANSRLQQQLLNAIAHSQSIHEAARRMAVMIGTQCDALQLWLCHRGASSGQVMQDGLLELELDSILKDCLPHLPLQVDQLAGWTLSEGRVGRCKLSNGLQLTSVPVFFTDQRPMVLICLTFQYISGSANQFRASGDDSDFGTKLGRSSDGSVVSSLQLLSNHLTLWHSQQNKGKIDSTFAGILQSNLHDILTSNSKVQACSLLCTRIASYVGASHVAVFSNHSFGQIRLAGFSGTTQVDRSSQVFQALQNVCLHLTNSETADDLVSSHHKGASGKLLNQVSKALNQTFCLAAKIKVDQKLHGIAIFIGDPSFEQSMEGSKFADSFGSISEQLTCAIQWHRSPMYRTWQRTVAFAKKYRWWVAGATAVFTGLAALPVPYHMNCDCQLSTLHKRYVVAPYEGQLTEILVEPGQVVQANDVIAKMDDQELRLELIGKRSEFDREQQKSQSARATGNLAEAKIAELESQRIQQEIQLIETRLDNQDIRSPILGTVIQGDVRKLAGAPVELGQNLFEIAPLERLVVEIALPEYQFRYAKVGQKVNVNLDAYPFDSWTGEIKQLRTCAETRDGQNVFVAEVEIENDGAALRPGMKGSASINGDYYPLAWNWLHYPFEKARTLFRVY